MAFVRSAGIRGARGIIDELGGDAESLALASGLPAGALDDDEMLVQDLAIAMFLETCAAELACPDFGLRLALTQDLSMLGPLAVGIRNADTTTEALEMTSKYLFFHARSLEISVVDDPYGVPGVLGVRYGYHDDAMGLPPQVVDLGLLFLHRAMGSLIGPDYEIYSVELPNPLVAGEARYREVFGVPAHPDRPEAMLRGPAELLGRRIEGGDDAVHALALRYLESRLPAARRSFAERAREVLDRSLDTGTSSLADVAALLAVSPRTLQRRLAAEGTRYSAVLDAARRDLAARLLTDTDIPLYQIASAIALDDMTTFSAYARRWWGAPAREIRRVRDTTVPGDG